MLHASEIMTGEALVSHSIIKLKLDDAQINSKERTEKNDVQVKHASNGMVSGQDITEARFAEQLEIAELTLNITNPDIERLLADDSEFDAGVESFAFLFVLMQRHPEHKDAVLQKALSTEARFLRLFYGDERDIFFFPRVVHRCLPDYASQIKQKFLFYLYQNETSFDRYITSLARIEQFYAVFSAVGNDKSEKEIQFKFAEKIFGDLRRYALVKGLRTINHAPAAISASIIWCDSMALRISGVIETAGLMNFAKYASLPGEPALFVAFLNAHRQQLVAGPKTEQNAKLVAYISELRNHLQTKMPQVKSLAFTCADFISSRNTLFAAQLRQISTALQDVTFRQNVSAPL